MAGYAASARIQRASPHFARGESGVGVSRRALTRLARARVARAPSDQVENRVEPVGQPLDDRLARWVAELRDTWSQTTFYLFDPESWR